jgi:hypothetical protein
MIIKNADNVAFGLESERNNIKAQALTMRAYMYFCLVRTFGDAPIETEPTEGSAKPKQPRASKADVMQRVISDCETALSLFSGNDFVAGKSKASRMGAYALLADAYLWKASVLGGGKADYEKVIEYADLAAAKTSLEPVFDDIYGKRNGQEIIWSIHFGYPEIVDQYSKALKLRDQFVKPIVAAVTRNYNRNIAALGHGARVIGIDGYLRRFVALGETLGNADKQRSVGKNHTSRTYDQQKKQCPLHFISSCHQPITTQRSPPLGSGPKDKAFCRDAAH